MSNGNGVERVRRHVLAPTLRFRAESGHSQTYDVFADGKVKLEAVGPDSE